MEIKLPLLTLRDYQKDAWNAMSDKKISLLVWHRRAGKDLFCLNYLIAQAVKKVGNYFYILPQQNQVRRAIWEGVTKDGIKYLSFVPKQLVYKQNESEMKIVLRDPNNPNQAGSIISFIGGDNYDALAGSGISGCVISEYALQKPNLYSLILKPMLKETKGWCLLNTTPRGENHAYKMFENLKKYPNKYYVSHLGIQDTKLVTEEEIEEEREQGIPEAIIQQEYYSSFESANEGSYYGDVLKKFKEDNVGIFPYDAKHPVHTLWDLGISDDMAIWFVQKIDTRYVVVDYYENSSFGLQHYVDVITGKPYMYRGHHLPHDGRHRVLTSTERALTIEQQLFQLGLRNIQSHKRTTDVYQDIMAVRSLLSLCFFDEKKTADGYESLKQYSREFDEKRQTFKNTPLHDKYSHAADAFRILPQIQFGDGSRKVKVKAWLGLR